MGREPSTGMDEAGLIAALARTARRWRDPDHPARAEAVARTLAADNRFTAEATAFALNQQMHLLTPVALREWQGGRQTPALCTVGVLHPGNLPMVELQDFLAVVLAGHRYLGVCSSRSPFLMPAFVQEVQEAFPEVPARFGTLDDVWREATAVLATGSDETVADLAAACDAHGLPPARRLLRGHRYGVAVLDGRETAREREALAEDVWLHEGYGCRNVALVWAPAGTSPDSYLAAFAAFRGVFPTHPSTPGVLKMQQAFLQATGQPHAWGDGLAFLVSRGAPEPQRPGHLRWAEYADLAEVQHWLEAHRHAVQVVVARPPVAERLHPVPVELLGQAQRPPLDWQPDGHDTLGWLAQLACAK